jgi:hypothetical protein
MPPEPAKGFTNAVARITEAGSFRYKHKGFNNQDKDRKKSAARSDKR